ncbi:MAG: thioredoxin [Clostridia bacterium]|nr:thioredoxin [Clostridia bacterium]
MAVMKVSNDMFKEKVLSNPKPVLVDFYADWCGPCKMLAPLVEEISNESDAYEVVKLNVDDAPDLAARYGVMSIPTLIVFKNGEVAGRTVGVQNKANILKLIG